MRVFDRDLIRGEHYGQRSCEPLSKAEHMAASTQACDVKILLANSEPSTHGPSVWTGRALQAESDDLEKLVLRFCIRPQDGAFRLLAIMDIRARSISLRLGHEGQKGHLITNALARPFLHLLFSTRRPRRETPYCFWD